VKSLTTEEKLKHFEETSLEQAKSESMMMLREHKASLQKLVEEHKRMKKRQAELQLQTETVSLKREKNKALSKQQLALKRQIKKQQESLKDKLFVEVKTMLEEYMDTPAYQELLIHQIRDILKYAAGSPVTIYIDPADSAKLNSLRAAAGIPLTLSQISFMGGTRAVVENRHVLIDNSFATKLVEEKAEFTFNGGNSHE